MLVRCVLQAVSDQRLPSLAMPPSVSSPTRSSPSPVEPDDASTNRRGTAQVPGLVWCGAGVIVLAAVALRFWTRSPLWLDEALTVEIARLPVDQLLDALRNDGHPPLYYLLLHGWIELFGSGDVAVRAFSGIWSIAALGVMGTVARRRFGPRVALVAVVLLATSPYALRYATEARMYSMVVVLVLLGWWAGTAALERPSRWRLAGVAAATAALLLTHYWSFYLLVTVGVLLIGAAWRRPSRSPVLVLGAMAVGGLAFLPWLPSFLYQAAHTGTPWGRPERPAGVLVTGLTDFGGGPYGEAQLLGFTLMALALLALGGRTIDRHRIELDLRTRPVVRREALVIAGTLAVSVAAGYAANSAFASRYLAVVFPLFVLMAAVGTLVIGRSQTQVALVLVLALLGLGCGVKALATERTQAGQITDVVNAAVQPGDVVAFCPDQLGPSTLRLLPEGTATMTYPDGEPAGLVNWVDYADRMADGDPAVFAASVDAAAEGHAVWLVWSGGYGGLATACETVATELQALRPAVSSPVESGGEFEHAWLYRFEAS